MNLNRKLFPFAFYLLLYIYIFPVYIDGSGKLSSLAVSKSNNIPKAQLNALLELYYQTNGPYWSWYNTSTSVPWNVTDPNANPCLDNWQGVTCQPSTGFGPKVVAELKLSSHNISGPLPSSIGNLNNLTILDLGKNNFTGLIPESIGNFTELTELNLHSNHFEGDLPTNLYSLSLLEYLDLSENRLHGIIPDDFYNLTKLMYLDLSINRFTGNISSKLGDFIQLDTLFFLEID